ncbi:MAG TPA: hypothetical protein PK653_05955, partial [Syntrophales bacterium]|nr:hypothetical protein [Syntrophales bacterium]
MAHHSLKPGYADLVERLNRFPQGAPPSNLLYRILQVLFTEKEASLVSLLPIKPFSAEKAARIDPEEVEEGCSQVVRPDRVDGGVGSVLVTGPVDLASRDAGPGEGEAEDVPPVVASSLGVDLRGTSEFADGDDERGLKQPALLKVFNEGGKCLVELGAE